VVKDIEVLVHAEILPDATVPKTGAVNVGEAMVGEVANTAEPVPVSSVNAARKFALDGVARKVATLAPRPDTPVATGNPVQLVRTPEAGVPSAGVTSVALVNKSALVSCLVTPPCTIGKTSVVTAELATGSAVMATFGMVSP
jgi:hypothetical protein